ncbi:HNH endonuclease signature motif containing protein [Arthrobacter sp. L77]|uniref:HNH endonuclease signature motif containing protein n=1 Tax=Arthrobacter sp. L77 TaxID=1496689 RepID=UPI000691F40E|nr:HNH endonuclease signature motif containing protein [Arthrobacter sp. L77]
MTVTPMKHFSRPASSLEEARSVLSDCALGLAQYHHLLSRQDALQFVIDVGQVSKVVDHLQILAARVADHHGLASEQGGSPGASPPAEAASVAEDPGATSSSSSVSSVSSTDTGHGFRDCADFLRETLGISRSEARRRLHLAAVVLPSVSLTGNPLPPPLEALGDAVGSLIISGRAATIVAQAIERVQSFATPDQLASMEQHLTRQAVESDEDILRILARRWESVLDQDGQEPTEKVLRARQGVFLKGRRHGLHVLEIGATDEQFEQLATVMNAAANPRGSSGHADHPVDGAAPDVPDRAAPTSAPTSAATSAFGTAPTSQEPSVGHGGPTRAQQLLDGLVSACRIALSTGGLPATGGHRPQVMVTIDYQDLMGETERAGDAIFSGQISARNIRRLACDADIVPLVLGGDGQVLDLGRAQRLFPPHLRRALVARDKGCAFPDCFIPASWCEAHHLTPWSQGGATSINNGVLLCSRHHHVIHEDSWTVESRGGIPWFTPPAHRRRTGTPRRNLYWQAGRAVRSELSAAPECSPSHQPTAPDRMDTGAG